MVELVVELEGIRQNTEAVAALLGRHGLDLVGVTKGCLGEPSVGRVMLEAGAVALADTRDANLRRLRAACPEAELHRIYLPPVNSAFEPADITYVSSLQGAHVLAALGSPQQPRRAMIHMETGDGREGAPAGNLDELATYVSQDRRLRLEGLATNYACFAGQPEGLATSLDTVASAARRLGLLGHDLARVSGGNSSVLAMLAAGRRLPAEITELRCGEALLLGQDALEYRPLEGCRQDACLLRAEVLESYTKPSPEAEELRLVLGLGGQDLGHGRLRFTDEAFSEAGRSADYLVVAVRHGGPPVKAGEVLEIIHSYYALSAAWTSPFVEVRLV
jgi:predicted amino acid racemase